MTPIFGVDVSHHQGHIDWAAVAAAGVRFGFAKATEATSFLDPQLAPNLAGMRAHGVLPGAYHFLRRGNGAAQADAFLHAVGDPTGVLLALDVEDGSLTSGTVADFAARFRALLPDRQLVIYTGRDLWPGGPGAQYGPLWDAGSAPNRYTAGPGSLAQIWARTTLNQPAFAGWLVPLIVQFTDAATVPGIPAPVDGNVLLGVLEQLHALTGADMPLNNDDAKLIADAIWKDPAQKRLNEPKTNVNDTDSFGDLLGQTRLEVASLVLSLRALAADVAALKAAFGGLPLPGGVDADALAVKVADLLAARLAQ